MQLNLNSAIGRQRRLNQIGETITSIAAPTAAYSLRSLTGGDPLAVRVRIAETTTERDFTVSEINSGELEKFCDRATPARNRTGGAKYSSFSASGVTGFSASTSNAAACGYDIFGASGTAVQVSFDIVLNSGSISVKLRPEFETGSDVSNSETISSSGSKSFTLTSTAQFKALLFIAASADFVVSNFSVNVPYNHSGFVSIWYDQIGSNNLVQTDTAKQPLIVDSGSLFLNTDGNKGISIERSAARETKLDFTSGFTIANSHTFQYLEFKRTFVDVLLSANGGGNIRIGRQSGTNLQIRNGGTQTFAAGITVQNNPLLYTTFLAADGNASKVHINGVEKQYLFLNKDFGVIIISGFLKSLFICLLSA